MGNGPRTGGDDGRALPVLRGLRIDLVQQRIPVRHISIPLWQRALRVRRFVSCQCRNTADEPRSFSALTLEGGMAPELAYVTTKFAALAPFAKVADLLADLLPVGGAVNAGTVRNRTRRIGERIARLRPEGAADPDVDAVTPAVVIGLDGGYLLSRHRRPERNFEVIAGKVLNLDGSQHLHKF